VFADLRELAAGRMEELGVPGATIGVLSEGEVATTGLGVTSLEHPLDVDADTLFQIGSITKTFTGTSALRLVEQRLLDLDAPVQTYLPELRLADPDVAERVTMRHLLTHTAGWVGDYFDDLGRGDDALTRMVSALAELPQISPLGELWSYNNAAFYVAGRIIEVVAERPFEHVVRDLVLEPLGLERSFFFADEVLTYRFVVGHVEDEDGRTIIARPWPIGRAVHPAGGLVSTVGDLLRYARFHLGDGTVDGGEAVLSKDSLELMRSPQVELTETDAMGLTWMLRRRAGRPTVGHGGLTNGQAALLTLVPDAGFGVAVLTNHAFGGLVAQDVTSAALREYLGLDELEPTAQPRTPDELQEYAGRYGGALADYELVVEDGRLVARLTYKGGFPARDSPPQPSPPPATIEFEGDDLVFVPEGRFKGARGQFLRDPEGRIAWLRLGSRAHARVSD
jgi:CubicO group peptidase (beta-lactamase class C family)